MGLQLGEPVARRHNLHAASRRRPAQRARGRDPVPDERMRALHRLRRHLPLRHLVIAPLERERLPAPGADHQVERLFEAPDALLPRHTVGGELLRHIARCHAEDEAPAREVVDDRDVFRELERRVERHQQDSRADPHPLGDRRGPRHRHQGTRAETVLLDMVGALEGRHIAQLLGPRQAAQHVPIGLAAGNAALWRHLVCEEKTELHRAVPVVPAACGFRRTRRLRCRRASRRPRADWCRGYGQHRPSRGRARPQRCCRAPCSPCGWPACGRGRR